jgi:hypothetical protein
MTEATISLGPSAIFVGRKELTFWQRLRLFPKQNPIGTVGAVVIIVVILVALRRIILRLNQPDTRLNTDR